MKVWKSRGSISTMNTQAGLPEGPNRDSIDDMNHWIVLQKRLLQLRLSV